MAPKLLNFSIDTRSSHSLQSSITATADLVAPLMSCMTEMYRTYTALPGFEHKELPRSYARSYFSKEIERDTQQFIFKHFVFDYLLSELTKRHIVITNWPQLTSVEAGQSGTLTYRFVLSCPQELCLKEWKHFVFKQPRRKNYKDLDNQVAAFIKEGSDLLRTKNKTAVEPGDWINFHTQLHHPATHAPLFDHAQSYWIHITEEGLSSALQESLLGRHIDETFLTPALPFTSSVYSNLQEPCHYNITVRSITKGQHLNLNFFKNTFRLKTRADVHKKLIEVFSYRDDISQRHAIVEELFHLLFTKHRFEVPKHTITRKKEMLLKSLRKQPDYQVYKSDKNFERNVEQLAEKMIKEEIIIDNIAHEEEIKLEATDIAQYLHLFNHERLREFIYFKPLIDNIEESDTPLHEGILAQAALREKTLNHIIYTLS